MFYRIRNHIFNLNEVIDIRAEDLCIVVDTKDNHGYVIPCADAPFNLNVFMDKIQKDLEIKGN